MDWSEWYRPTTVILVLNCNHFTFLLLSPFNPKDEIFRINDGAAVFAEDLKGEKDAGKPSKEETAKGNGKPPAERPRFMFNIADGGFTGES